MPSKGVYLMPAEMHVQLSYVRGFNTMNGDRYQDYIIMCLEENLNEEQKTAILQTRLAEEALSVLRNYNIEFTHEWEE
jgi:hypothetical protein